MKSKITRILIYSGIPADIKGFAYLRECILMVSDAQYTSCTLTKTIYPTVANMFNTTSAAVERAVRAAVAAAWHNGCSGLLGRCFAHGTSEYCKKPTNARFIYVVSQSLAAGVFDDI